MTTLMAAIIAAAVMGPGSIAQAAVRQVPAQYSTIQAAVNASANGDEIIVAPGTYFEAVVIQSKWITLRSSGGPDVTILDGAQNPNTGVLRVEPGFANELFGFVEGFTIRNGSGQDGGFVGGGIFLIGKNYTIRDCTIRDNAAQFGGGMFSQSDALNVFVENCRFINNVAFELGGGLLADPVAPTLSDCVFLGNSAPEGGGMYGSSVHVSRSRFEGNQATAGRGGAVYDQLGGGYLEDCTFLSNTSTAGGGAVRSLGLYSNRCRYDGNNTTGSGGAVLAEGSLLVENCIVANNTASQNGGGIGQGSSTNVTVTQSTFWGNSAGGAGGAIYAPGGATCNVLNSIAWANSPDGFNSVVSATYSDVQNVMPGAGNITADPQFVDAAGGDFALASISPCIEAGNTQAIPGDMDADFALEPRVLAAPDVTPTGLPVFGLYVDMGALEYQAPCAGSGSADLDGDGDVDLIDFSTFASQFTG